MTRAFASMRRAPAGMGLALAFLCAGGAPARAYDDSSTVSSVLGIFGVQTEEGQGEKIVFRERSKLVLPPSRQGLPEPREAAERPVSWPVDQETARRRGEQEPAPQAGLNQNPNAAEAKQGEPGAGPRKCLFAASDGHCTVQTDADEPGASGGARTRGAGEHTTRAHLTEPPAAFRQKVQGGKDVEEAEKSGNWLSNTFGGLFGGS